jgi:hypothetical protein
VELSTIDKLRYSAALEAVLNRALDVRDAWQALDLDFEDDEPEAKLLKALTDFETLDQTIRESQVKALVDGP